MHIFSRGFPRIGGRRRRSVPDLSTLFHQSPSGYVVLSARGVIEEANHSFAAWTGRNRSALEGTVFTDLLAPEDLLEYQRWTAALRSGTGPVQNLAVDFHGPDGERLPALIAGARSPGRGLDLISVLPETGRRRYERDLVEALQQAEAAEEARGAAELRARERESLLHAVLDTVDVGVLVVDRDGREILANALMESSRAGAATGDIAGPGGSEWPVYGPDRVTPLPDSKRPIRRAVSGESFAEEIVWVGTGQGQLAVSVSARSVRGGGGFKGSVLAFSDVTQLVRALTAQREFVANVSHELRTPLTSILGYLDMALDSGENLAEDVRSALQTAVRNAERLLQLVTDLLSVAAGNETVEAREVDLAAVVRAAVDSFGPRARVNGVEFKVDLPGDLSAVADPRRIGQVLENLVSNAVKYSPDGGVVQVSARVEAGMAVIEVADSGMGMSQEEQEAAFTPFFRSGRALTAAIPGAGLGLVISRRIVEEHGGNIRVRSEPGAGTLFTVSLPVAGPDTDLQS
ncbi:PAS domain S-box protein [Arthrobacter sp. zg-Y20]|uniref:ATP-binding protein n=1 Tax=unclassified Arthrobacter TaxID=235627 RepID=UPI001D1402AF|nr:MULTISPECIES: ATP-binding protein [unclassified Arthrobacter]MCC3275517.1 PAS domain S-box protein [Arthrobacter sp. zg-Y20]MDK1315674.1 ATP-binding protein [Arthrobacter sp. zg.Y20]WIB06084.1 ATP-binding protein [Arthrobacter sp. zg-Y20]